MAADTQMQLKTITEKITSLPTLPTVVSKMGQLLQDPRTTAEEVGKAISNDQSIASKVLKLVNSAFYGFPGRISTITHAIVILGFGTVKNIVLTASIFDSFGGKEETSAFNIEDFWMHSIAVGAGAKIIAQQSGFKSTEECFLGGLIHDIGKIVLSQHAPKELSMVVREVTQKNCLFYEAEKNLLGVTHQELGGWLAEKWNLPTDLCHAIEHHHYPKAAGEHFKMAAAIHLSDILIRSLGIGSGGDNKIPTVNDEVWATLKVDQMDLKKLLTAIDEEVERASIFFSIL